MELTPNQLVAYNLARLRRERGLTQEQAAELLEPYLGIRWSKASFSQVEQSVLGTRSREFTGDDLVAFARAFEVPLAWFFMPPEPGALGVRRGDQPEPPDLLNLLFGTEPRFESLWQRLLKLVRESPPELRAKRQAAIGGWLGRRFGVLLEAELGPLDELAEHLMHLARALMAARDQTRDEAVDRATGGQADAGIFADRVPAPKPKATRRR